MCTKHHRPLHRALVIFILSLTVSWSVADTLPNIVVLFADDMIRVNAQLSALCLFSGKERSGGWWRCRFDSALSLSQLPEAVRDGECGVERDFDRFEIGRDFNRGRRPHGFACELRLPRQVARVIPGFGTTRILTRHYST
jgi:hypothetical protein